ncbi:hypothetical protein C8039_09855 [Halogeometricum sp. wsp3]|nr:hypothetical protein C8039_09855 [Halogeometricum sp. wsp3]
MRAPYAFSDVGEVSNTDAIPQAADELETLEGVSAVVIVGEKEGTMRIAERSRDDRVHIGRAIEAVVEISRWPKAAVTRGWTAGKSRSSTWPASVPAMASPVTTSANGCSMR